jgi:hypothetical protein
MLAGAEHPRLAGADHDSAHLRVFEVQPLDGVRKLDVDTEIVGVELELITFEQRALLVDVQKQGRDIAVDLELPMPIARRLGLEIDPRPAVSQRTLGGMGVGHSSVSLVCIIIHIRQRA